MSKVASSAGKPYEIVVGFDFSPLAERALEEALDIADRRAPAELHVVTIAQPAGLLVHLPGHAEPLSEDLAREAVKARVAALVTEFGVKRGALKFERVAIYVLSGPGTPAPGTVIAELARAIDAQVIVVGTHGRTGMQRLVFGSVAQQVVREATTSVYVVQPGDFVRGEQVPAIEPPLSPGEPHLREFAHGRTYHYVDKIAPWTTRTMPVS